MVKVSTKYDHRDEKNFISSQRVTMTSIKQPPYRALTGLLDTDNCVFSGYAVNGGKGKH